MRSDKLQVIFDTSPLITLCSFRAQEELAIEHLLPFLDALVVQTVSIESTANPKYADAKAIQLFLGNQQILSLPIPTTSLDSVIDQYTKLGNGERDTLRLAITNPQAQVILDDYLAFVIATRFHLRPLLLLDLLVLLVESHNLDRQLAVKILDAIKSRYSAAFVEHTRVMLLEVLP